MCCICNCRLSDVKLISVHEGEETNDFCALIGDKSHYHSMLEGKVVNIFCLLLMQSTINFAFETLLFIIIIVFLVFL